MDRSTIARGIEAIVKKGLDKFRLGRDVFRETEAFQFMFAPGLQFKLQVQANQPNFFITWLMPEHLTWWTTDLHRCNTDRYHRTRGKLRFTPRVDIDEFTVMEGNFSLCSLASPLDWLNFYNQTAWVEESDIEGGCLYYVEILCLEHATQPIHCSLSTLQVSPTSLRFTTLPYEGNNFLRADGTNPRITVTVKLCGSDVAFYTYEGDDYTWTESSISFDKQLSERHQQELVKAQKRYFYGATTRLVLFHGRAVSYELVRDMQEAFNFFFSVMKHIGDVTKTLARNPLEIEAKYNITQMFSNEPVEFAYITSSLQKDVLRTQLRQIIDVETISVDDRNVDQLEDQIRHLQALVIYRKQTDQPLRKLECDICKASDKVIKACAGCKKAHYCGPECQTKGWIRGHAKECE
jgi:hypothetical protein